MGDMRDTFRAMDDARKERAERRRKAAAQEYPEAATLAGANDLNLIRRSDQHYQLTGRKPNQWIMNLYPGNGRLFGDKKHMPPFLRVSAEWTLSEVVNAAIAVTNRRGNRSRKCR